MAAVIVVRKLVLCDGIYQLLGLVYALDSLSRPFALGRVTKLRSGLRALQPTAWQLNAEAALGRRFYLYLGPQWDDLSPS